MSNAEASQIVDKIESQSVPIPNPTDNTMGEGLLVDEADRHLLSQYRWTISMAKAGYPRARAYDKKSKRYLFLHRLITSCPEGFFVDHINHNGLDNRRQNLRVCTNSQNQMNSLRKSTSFGFKGIYRSTKKSHRNTPFGARIQANSKRLFLGLFSTPEEAAKAYDCAAKRHFGEFAKLNFEQGKT